MESNMDRRAFVAKALLGGLVGAGLAGLPRIGESAVDVHIGVNLPAPPRFVVVPGAPAVAYAPGVRANYFRYGSHFYVYDNGGWYVSNGYNGPWAVIDPVYVPRPILAVPVRYYRRPPSDWRRYRRDAPPQWESHWGRHWDEHRGRGVRYESQDGWRRDRDGDHRR